VCLVAFCLRLRGQRSLFRTVISYYIITNNIIIFTKYTMIIIPYYTSSDSLSDILLSVMVYYYLCGVISVLHDSARAIFCCDFFPTLFRNQTHTHIARVLIYTKFGVFSKFQSPPPRNKNNYYYYATIVIIL